MITQRTYLLYNLCTVGKNMNKELLAVFSKNSILSVSDMKKMGYSKYFINIMVRKGELQRVARGMYSLTNDLEDEFYLAQFNNSQMIFSNETAAYLHQLTGRYPHPLSVTTVSGCHLRNNSLKKYYVQEALFKLGVITIIDPAGNPVITYDKERTLCDIVKNRNRIEEQIYLETIQNYFGSGHPNYRKLAEYADKLSVSKRVEEITNLFTKP